MSSQRNPPSFLTDALRTQIPPALKRLVTNPERLGAVSLWNALGPEEREAAAWAMLATDAKGRERLAMFVAEARNFRPATVRKWSEEKIVTTVMRMPVHDPNVAMELLTCHHVPGQMDMVTAFLDALGVSHDRGSVESFAPIGGDEERVRAAVREMVERHGARASVVYLLALRFFGAPAGETGRLWVEERLAAAIGEGEGESGAEAEEDRADDSETVEDGDEVRAVVGEPAREPSFTTLDRLLIHAAVDSAQGIQGALGEGELDEVVKELVTLNGRRHQSYFHAGFRDVLFDRPVADELRAENESRLRWYWTGAVQGWARRGRWDRIVREHAANPVVRGLGSGTDAASAAAVRHVVEALRREGRTPEIARFVKVPAAVGQPELFGRLLDAATELLGKGDAASALPVFELLMKARTELEGRGVPPTERLLLDGRRRMAHCLRHLHQHARARELLTGLLRQDPDPDIHAMVHADLGLMNGGFDGLDEVVLPPRRDELDGVLDRLAEGVGQFHESVDMEVPHSAHGHYCLGVLALGRAVDDHAFEDAELHLQHARVHFSEAGDSYSGDLVEHANLYFGIAKALQLSSNKLAHAGDVIARSLASGARMPAYLIDQTVEAFGLAEEKRDLRRVTEAIIGAGGDRALDALAACDAALAHCPALADRLRERGRDSRRGAAQRAADLRAALRGFRERGDGTALGGTLDDLERLARNDVAVPEFLALLGDRTSYDLAWDLEDATIARARCHEDRGEFLDAVAVLREHLFFRLATPEREAGVSDAAGILARIRRYGIDSDYYSAMTNRYDALAAREAEAETPEGPGPARVVRVLVVGGAEQQARAEDAVRARLKEQYPHIRARFIRTGWSGNWSRPISEIERELEKNDALVIIRFMRTHLGREIRRIWKGPWRSCWSGGTGAIVEAVARVAAVAR